MGSLVLNGFLHSLLGWWSPDEGNHRSQEWAGDGGGKPFLAGQCTNKACLCLAVFWWGRRWKGDTC